MLKPVICSFGHRPSSASRTFHPATMKLRLKHGEIIKTTMSATSSQSLPNSKAPSQTGCGLSVAVLSKLLYAPKLYHTDEGASEDALNSLFGNNSDASQRLHSKSAPGTMAHNVFDPNDLFSMPSQEVNASADADDDGDPGGGKMDMLTSMKMFNKQKKSQTQKMKQGDGAAGGRSHGNKSLKNKNSGAGVSMYDDELVEPEPIGTFSLAPLSVTGGIDRPLWVDGFHQLDHPPSEKYNLRHSVITEGSQDMPLHDRLKRYVIYYSTWLHLNVCHEMFFSRFATKTVAEKQLMPTCQGRQRNDITELSGARVMQPKAEPVKGQVLYFDPLDKQLQDVISYREQLVQQREERMRAKLYQDALKTIPVVEYNAISSLHSHASVASQSELQSLSATSSVVSKRSNARQHPSHGALDANSLSSGRLTGSHSDGHSNSSGVVATEDLQRALTEGLTDEQYRQAMKAAKRGDTRALYAHFMTVDHTNTHTITQTTDVYTDEDFMHAQHTGRHARKTIHSGPTGSDEKGRDTHEDVGPDKVLLSSGPSELVPLRQLSKLSDLSADTQSNSSDNNINAVTGAYRDLNLAAGELTNNDEGMDSARPSSSAHRASRHSKKSRKSSSSSSPSKKAAAVTEPGTDSTTAEVKLSNEMLAMAKSTKRSLKKQMSEMDKTLSGLNGGKGYAVEPPDSNVNGETGDTDIGFGADAASKSRKPSTKPTKSRRSNAGNKDWDLSKDQDGLSAMDREFELQKREQQQYAQELLGNPQSIQGEVGQGPSAADAAILALPTSTSSGRAARLSLESVQSLQSDRSMKSSASMSSEAPRTGITGKANSKQLSSAEVSTSNASTRSLKASSNKKTLVNFDDEGEGDDDNYMGNAHMSSSQRRPHSNKDSAGSDAFLADYQRALMHEMIGDDD
jgi:hypothetical protein